MDALEEVLQSINDVCFGVGLYIILQLKDPKISAIHPSTSLSALPRSMHLNPNEQPVEVVEEFQLFGTIISQDCTLDRDIDKRISKDAHTLDSLYKVLWYRTKVKLSTKACLFKSV